MLSDKIWQVVSPFKVQSSWHCAGATEYTLRFCHQYICSLIWGMESLHTYMIINSVWSSGAIWRHGSESALAQVMACCLTAPSHYLNQYWLTINDIFKYSLRAIQMKCSRYLSLILIRKLWIQNYIHISQAPMISDFVISLFHLIWVLQFLNRYMIIY